MSVVRSPYAHAAIKSIDLEQARALPGVFAAFAASELVSTMPPVGSFPFPGPIKKPDRRPLALDHVRYVGDPLAVVLANSLYTAQDACDLVDVDYEPLPAVTDPEAALAPDAPVLYDEFGSNEAFRAPAQGGDIAAVFAQAEHTVRLRLVNQRLSPGSLEPRACLFDFDPASSQLTAWISSQSVFRARDTLISALQLDPARVRVYNADVGGGFGAKTTFLGEELVAAALAIRYGRPVKWIENRSENLQAQTHGRGQVNYIEAAFQSDGRLLGLKLRTVADLGAFLIGTTAMIPTAMTPSMLSGAYQLQAIDSLVIGAYTNKVPTAAYRGAGRPEAAYIIERTIDRVAHELNLDPAEVRRRNFIEPSSFPYTVATGVRYDSGNYQAALDQALELVNYEHWRMLQRERRASDHVSPIGIGLATFVETSGDRGNIPAAFQEAATVRIRRDGSVLVQNAVAHNGQGHFTAFAQIAASVFQLPAEKIEVQMNDSALPGYSIGTFGSRVTQVAGSTVLLAAEAARAKALQVAAQVLEAAPADLLLEDGKVIVRGVPSRSIELGELARIVEEQPDLIEHEPPNPANGAPIEGLAAWRSFSSAGPGFSSGAHIAVVEIDIDTGEIHILAYVAVDDCGTVLNHYMAEMQVHGALAQGIGQALYEEVAYDDESGQILSATLMDYALPIASELPTFVTGVVETPSPNNPLGAKGVGEGGCIAAPPTIVNAVLDALAPLGITSIDMPLKPEKVWSLIHSARHGTLHQPDPMPTPIFSS
jgi:carbon-monoxide dehydrogenase large subunit